MKKCRSINNSLRARSISKTYQPALFHLGECASYQPAIDQSDWPIQTVIVQLSFKMGCIIFHSATICVSGKTSLVEQNKNWAQMKAEITMAFELRS